MRPIDATNDGVSIQRVTSSSVSRDAGRRRDGVISGYVFKLVRETLGLTQEALAELLAVDTNTIQGWETDGAVSRVHRQLASPSLGGGWAVWEPRHICSPLLPRRWTRTTSLGMPSPRTRIGSSRRRILSVTGSSHGPFPRCWPGHSPGSCRPRFRASASHLDVDPSPSFRRSRPRSAGLLGPLPRCCRALAAQVRPH
jgi:hypothetical protein